MAGMLYSAVCHEHILKGHATLHMQTICRPYETRECLVIHTWWALQEMRTYKEAEQAGKHVGFELINSVDIAVASPVAGPWYAICPTSTNAMYESVQQMQDMNRLRVFLSTLLPLLAMYLPS